MTWKDKLEIGLKEDAPYRKDNLPDQQVRGPEVPAGEGRSPVVPAAANDVNKIGQAHGRPKRIRKKFRTGDDSFNHIETLYGIGYRYKEH